METDYHRTTEKLDALYQGILTNEARITLVQQSQNFDSGGETAIAFSFANLCWSLQRFGLSDSQPPFEEVRKGIHTATRLVAGSSECFSIRWKVRLQLVAFQWQAIG